jgi:hypothetical protein
MKILKKILITIVAIIALLLVIALFVKKDYAVEKEVLINKPKTEVYEYVKYLKNQNNYSKWAKMDPNMTQTFSGTDGTVGFISAWEGNSNVGKGEQEIKKLQEGERIDYEIRFIKPFESVAPSYMTTEAAGDNQTKVKWGFSGSMPYPMNIMRLFMNIPEMIGKDLQTGLDNLKNILEKQ